jgi:protein-S-isoprenylcysteine O-methyltransferase Ste14
VGSDDRMTIEKLKAFAIISVLLVLSGVIMIFNSVNFGTSIADSWLADRGGADTGFYLIVVEGYINNFLVFGGILFCFGLILLPLTYYKILNLKN